MRKREGEGGPLTVHAVAGSHVVILGMNINDRKKLKNFRGFAIQRTDHTEGETYFLQNFKRFESQQKKKSSFDNPIQEFVWGDYTAKENHEYTYRVVTRYGEPGKLASGPEVSVRVKTENAEDATHCVYFNRGVGGSQAYATRYFNLPPEKARLRVQKENKTAAKKKEDPFVWLSRGLYEALVRFIEQAGPGDALRASLYEFRYDGVAKAFAAAAKRGADVKIVFDAKNNQSGPNAKKQTKAFPRLENLAVILKAKLKKFAIPRESGKSAISHNKFIILIRNKKPIQVWTGSTNISEGGIFGHSNVGHLVRDEGVARSYLRYWNAISKDPDAKVFRQTNDKLSPVPTNFNRSPLLKTIFSPRGSLQALESYAKRMNNAKQSVFFTAAFGVSKELSAVLQKPRKYLRYILLEKSDDNTTQLMKRDQQNRFAVGSLVPANALENWVQKETLTGLNTNVKYIHTKFMLIDPLTDDPTVITGSANFSKPSTDKNDENMLVIRGDTRVADIYLGEFMRLFHHYEFRQHLPKPGLKAKLSIRKKGDFKPQFLRESDDWWKRFYERGSARMKERLLFA